MSDEQFMKVSEVAELLQVAENTIWQWVMKGKIPHVKLNGVTRFEREAIGKWIEESRNGGETRS